MFHGVIQKIKVAQFFETRCISRCLVCEIVRVRCAGFWNGTTRRAISTVSAASGHCVS